MALFPEKFSCSSSQSGIQIDREEDRLKIFYEVWRWGVEDNRINLRGMFDLVI
jgi:hypothetical protein